MDKQLFERLVLSMKQHGEITRDERAPSREFFVDAAQFKGIRAAIGLSQPKFARLIDVDVGTLRNWEQGRREPTGPARALLRAIKTNPRVGRLIYRSKGWPSLFEFLNTVELQIERKASTLSRITD
jgi:putative transcriptional regulator